VAHDDGGGRYLTAAQTQRLADAMVRRRTTLGGAGHLIWPLSRNTLNLWSAGKGHRAQIGRLADVDQVMWWEPGSALAYARGEGPLRPLPDPTDFQWKIFVARCERRLRYGDVALEAGHRADGTPQLTADDVERFERHPLYEPPPADLIAALAASLGLNADHLARLAAESVQPSGDAATEKAIGRFLHQVHSLPLHWQAAVVDTATFLAGSDEIRQVVDLLADLPEHTRVGTVRTIRRLLADVELRQVVERFGRLAGPSRIDALEAFTAVVRGLSRTAITVEPVDYEEEAVAIARNAEDETLVEQFRDEQADDLAAEVDERPGGDEAG